jgi:Fe-S cluster assembly ATP-binding protein
VTFKGSDVLALPPDERARQGMFLAMQYPVEVPGVSVTNFLRTAMNAVRDEEVPVREFARDLREQMKLLDMDPKFAERSLNEGFSGGEKKRHEILQMALLRPSLAILDETDSGLDIDALKVVSEGVNRMRGSDVGVLLITHYTRILRYITPDVVHVMLDGLLVKTGGRELADELEEHGYERLRTSSVA